MRLPVLLLLALPPADTCMESTAETQWMHSKQTAFKSLSVRQLTQMSRAQHLYLLVIIAPAPAGEGPVSDDANKQCMLTDRLLVCIHSYK